MLRRETDCMLLRKEQEETQKDFPKDTCKGEPAGALWRRKLPRVVEDADPYAVGADSISARALFLCRTRPRANDVRPYRCCPILPRAHDFSTILHRFYKTDTNQPRCGTGTGEPMAGRQRQGLRADIAQDTAAAHAERDEAVVDTRVRQPEKIGIEGRLHRRAAGVKAGQHTVSRQHHHLRKANPMLPAARAAYTPYKTGLRPQWSLAAGQSNRPAALAALPTATHKGAHCSGRPRSAAMVRISG